jgi:hypothetical protein
MFAEHFEVKKYDDDLYCVIFKDSIVNNHVFMDGETFEIFSRTIALMAEERGSAAAVPTPIEGQTDIFELIQSVEEVEF